MGAQRSMTKKGVWREQLVGAGLVPGTAAEEYLASRGLGAAVAQVSGARYAPAFFGRPAVAFPLRAPDRIIVAVQGQFIDGQRPATRRAGPSRAGVFTTTGDFASRTVAVTEGPLDALSLAQLGIPGIALCEKAWPGWLPKVLFGSDVYLAFAANRNGDRIAEELGEVLSRVQIRWQRLRPAGFKDWNAALLAGEAALPVGLGSGLEGEASSLG